MATVVLPRSLIAILPGAARRVEVAGGTVASVIDELDQGIPGIRNRLVDAGPSIRQHLNVFVDGQRAELHTIVAESGVVHVIPAVSGGQPATSLDPDPWPRTGERTITFARERR